MSRHLPLRKPEDLLRMSTRVTLPWHNKDLKRGTLALIIEQSGHTTEEFLKLL